MRKVSEGNRTKRQIASRHGVNGPLGPLASAAEIIDCPAAPNAIPNLDHRVEQKDFQNFFQLRFASPVDTVELEIATQT
jgi:hypothetical protein